MIVRPGSRRSQTFLDTDDETMLASATCGHILAIEEKRDAAFGGAPNPSLYNLRE